MKKKMYHYYLCFAQDMDVSMIPFGRLAETGTWSRRSVRILEGRSELRQEELKAFLYSACGISPSRFRIMDEKDSIYLER